jgi:hypothetical protein
MNPTLCHYIVTEKFSSHPPPDVPEIEPPHFMSYADAQDIAARTGKIVSSYPAYEARYGKTVVGAINLALLTPLPRE